MKFLSGPFWMWSHTHDFILKWQEKQSAQKQGFSSSPNSSGCRELLKCSKYCQLALTYVNELQMWGSKFWVICARTEGTEGACVYFQIAPFMEFISTLSATLKPLSHILNYKHVFNSIAQYPFQTDYYVLSGGHNWYQVLQC